MTTPLQIALLLVIGYCLVSVGMDAFKKYSYEQLSERYGLQVELESRLPETRLNKLKKNGASRWTYRRFIRQYVAN